ncbi:hypothetical protein E1A91_D13G140700v1 [Gossypium mustelinum]|uniref:AP2/ERF domain-containing protein n=3 Tax=Gossypium TaxID=3633 RepID=A0A5J5NLE6_GOSBA|nr:hypothetical protein ES319_D13G137600v1 [Gossypium barbadense]PPD97259.1 hypothetical protein GOBAR_DD05707 [Gossypium barbadense]TYG37503.1 hypothetical protein ES288_D13G146600v1 [Gossypium darwinii]TYI46976.1 hypothetical protein E1A91_D13G140700v1 [Gossypium mustelinum]
MSGFAAEERSSGETKYKGVRRRRWGKWVSEIRVPGSQERLWLGSYSTPEAAAIAHDLAFYCLRRPSSLTALNFPSMLPPYVSPNMSPRSIERAASDAGMAVDAAHMIRQETRATENVMSVDIGVETEPWDNEHHSSCGSWEKQGEPLSISVDDYLYF